MKFLVLLYLMFLALVIGFFVAAQFKNSDYWMNRQRSIYTRFCNWSDQDLDYMTAWGYGCKPRPADKKPKVLRP